MELKLYGCHLSTKISSLRDFRAQTPDPRFLCELYPLCEYSCCALYTFVNIIFSSLWYLVVLGDFV